MLTDWYLSFYSIGSLIVFLMTSVVTFYLFSLRPKSSATLVLALAFLMLPAMSLAYTFSSTWYHPYAAYHRIVTVFFSMLNIMITHIFFHYPRNDYPKTALTFLIIQWAITLPIGIWFTYTALNADYVFHFDGHYWDISADRVSEIYGAIIVLHSLTYTCVWIWRQFTLKGRERWTTIGMGLALTICGFLQAATNVMSRNGALDRGVFQTTYVVTAVAGFFVVFVIFINNTRDRTSFMARLVGISLVTLMLVMQGLSLVTLRDRNLAYDQGHRDSVELILARDDRPEDLVYLREYDLANDSTSFYFTNSDITLKDRRGRIDVLNTVVLERLARLEGKPNSREEIENVLNSAHPEFAGYRAYIRSVLAQMPPDQDPIPEVLARVGEIQTNFAFGSTRKKIQALPETEATRDKALALLGGAADGQLAPFFETVFQSAELSEAEPEELKADILEYMQPAVRSGVRRYREAQWNPSQAYDYEHFVAFVRPDLEKNVVYEAGFSYRAYRAYIHPTARELFFMLLAVFVVIVIGFQFFFRGALITPLRNLLSGVRQVNEGDLDVTVGVRVEDEIGYLSHSFNGMVSSIRDQKQKLQDYAENLEEKVKERTAELRETLEQVQQLKNQQDGDYFLTSLLIRPLGSNRAESDNVDVDFLVRQKKKFAFRKWSEEIGGDLCMARTVQLRGKPYTVFLNADAMGKSMQGAGGALVLGAVFDALLERTEMSSDAQNQFPERWLKNAFIELHKVFEGFDGSMLVSLVVGLVEDGTGLLYFVNAEHPWTVLFRNDKAQFIEEELTFRKLGTLGLQGDLFIRTFQMEPGDVIIAGTDGRDDVRVTGEDGEEYISDDEYAFLKHVEEGRGLLDGILSSITQRGDLTDDLALLRISFKEDHPIEDPDGVSDKADGYYRDAVAASRNGDVQKAITNLEAARALEDHSPKILKMLTRAYLEQKDYEKAVSNAEDYCYIRPGDTEFLYLISFCYRKLERWKQAADYGERVRLREPHHMKNLVQLAGIHARIGNTRRAEDLLDQALQIEPDNARAKKMLESLRDSVLAD